MTMSTAIVPEAINLPPTFSVDLTTYVRAGIPIEVDSDNSG